MNPFLVLLALVLGFTFSWFVIVVKRVERPVPALGAVPAQSGWIAPPFARDEWTGTETGPLPASEEPTAPLSWATTPDPADDPADEARPGEALSQVPGEEAPAEEEHEPEPAADDQEEPAERGETVSGLPPSAPAPAAGGAPVGYTVKADQAAQLYLLPSDPDFERAMADQWFVDEEAAQGAGYRHFERVTKPRKQ